MYCVWKRFQCYKWGKNDVNRHKDTSKHKGYVVWVWRCYTTTTMKIHQFCYLMKINQLIKFSCWKLRSKIRENWTAFFWFSGRMQPPFALSTADHTAKIFRNMLPGCKISNKHRCDCTKTTHVLTGAVAKKITSDLKEELLLTGWYVLATDRSSDKGDKFLPVVRHADEDSRPSFTSLLDMPSISSGSIAQQMYDISNEVREAFSLNWCNCMTYSSENINLMTWTCNIVLQKIRSAEDDQKIFDVGCPYHLTHLCAGKGAKELSVTLKIFLLIYTITFAGVQNEKNLRNSHKL